MKKQMFFSSVSMSTDLGVKLFNRLFLARSLALVFLGSFGSMTPRLVFIFYYKSRC